jgi:DNA-binding NarL/FixJ family response regulator
VLLAPDDLLWAAVRALLQSLSNVQVLCDVSHVGDLPTPAFPAAPDAILSALRLSGDATLPLLQELRTHWPATRIMLLLDGHQHIELDGYATLAGVSCLCWNDLTPGVLRHCLETVLDAPVELQSTSLRAAVVAWPDPVRPAGVHGTPPVDPRARAVLTGLAAGLTQQQVALAAGLSPRTVQRIIATLQVQLHAPSLFALGCTAERLGYIGCAPPDVPDSNDGQNSPPG